MSPTTRTASYAHCHEDINIPHVYCGPFLLNMKIVIGAIVLISLLVIYQCVFGDREATLRRIQTDMEVLAEREWEREEEREILEEQLRNEALDDAFIIAMILRTGRDRPADNGYDGLGALYGTFPASAEAFFFDYREAHATEGIIINSDDELDERPVVEDDDNQLYIDLNEFAGAQRAEVIAMLQAAGVPARQLENMFSRPDSNVN